MVIAPLAVCVTRSPVIRVYVRAALAVGTKPFPGPAAVSCRGSLVVAGQRIHVGIHQAGRTITVEDADTTWRIYHGADHLLEVARTNTSTKASR